MIQALIQAGAGSCERQVHDEGTLEYIGTRCVSRPYPYPYGFVIGTRTADGGGVDCYVLTTDPVRSGTIVSCEPIGLLAQIEDGEADQADRKVLAALPGQEVALGQDLLRELREFVYAVFAETPNLPVRVGPILPREAALSLLQDSRSS